MNSIILTGRLTRAPELKSTPDGVLVTSFSIAVKRPRVKDTVDFINIVAWRNTADFICRYFGKGDPIAVKGCLTSRKWTDREGNSRVAFEVVAEDVEFCGSKADSGAGDKFDGQERKTSPAPSYDADDDFELMTDGDMPF